MAFRANIVLVGEHILKSKQSIKQSRWSRRQFSKESDKNQVNIPPNEYVCNMPPLSQPLPGLATPIYATSKFEDQETQITTLSNGLRVASEKRFGQFCTIGVVIDSGCRYEVAYPSGISHFLEKLAFGSTRLYGKKKGLLHELEKHGGICDCQSTRDAFLYASSADRRGLSAITRLLGEIVLRPEVSQEEFEFARQSVNFDLETLAMRPEQETLLTDLIHTAAFHNNTLGLPKICPRENLDKIDRKALINYLSSHYVPTRMVVAGVGVEHEALVEAVQNYFVDTPPIWSDIDTSTLMKPDTSIAHYTGGIIQDACDIPLYPGTELPELSHIVIGLEGCSHQDEDFIAICVLNMMMGGGGSFSAGGPGKGMYTRLYTNVLNRHHWMYNATAYNHAYADTGLFCIHASSPPHKVADMVDIITKELVAMAGNCSGEELRRAKTQLQSMLLMNLEARPVVFEDIARQVLASGMRRSPKFFIDAIEAITVSDIKRVAQKMLSAPPSVAARGKLQYMPPEKQIQDAFAQPLMSRLSLFR